VLIVDMDPQGNSTSGVGVQKSSLTSSTYDALVGEVDAGQIILHTAVDGLDLMPSDVRLAGAEVELVPQIAREGKLRGALKNVETAYDIILIDCPPSLGLLTVNALTAADACLIPLQCEFYALEGLAQLMDTIALVRRHLNPTLSVVGIVLTMVDPRTKLCEQVAADVRAHFPGLVFSTEIPRSVRLAEAPSYGQPVLSYAPSSRGAAAYMALAGELSAKLGMTADGQSDTLRGSTVDMEAEQQGGNG
jgi:chromosome partitioning protein